MVLSMEQKCGINHPTLQPGFKQVFKNLCRALSAIGLVAITSAPVVSAEEVTKGAGQVLPTNLAALRDGFERAERQAGRADADEFLRMYKQFSTYPLWPYLESAYLQNNLSLNNEARIVAFMEKYYGSAAERSLREAWLDFLSRRNDGARYQRDFVSRGSELQLCRYLNFRLRDEGPSDELWDMVNTRWLQASSQPRACDPVFRAWQDAGQRTTERVWQRFDLAVNAGNWGLARYIRSLLPDTEQTQANEILRIRQRPTRLSQYQRLNADDARARDHAYLAMQRLVWQDLRQAQRLWPGLNEYFEFSASQRNATVSLIGVVLSVRAEPQARQWFDNQDVDALSEPARHWYLATLLREQDFAALLELTEQLPHSAQQQYWQARALQSLNRSLEAEPVWQALAQQRHYYGFMAAAQLDQPVNMDRESVTVPQASINMLLSRAEIQRAYEFYQLGRYFDARREWNLARARLGEDERLAAAVLAYQWDWLDQSIRELAQLGQLSDLERRFPLGYAELLVSASENQGIDPSWAFAIIRRESAFQTDALSPAGARGLMQIMPDTADYLQRQQPGPTNRRPVNLNQPDENIRLGTRYLAELLNRHSGNWLLATASYNAGYYRVRQWVPDDTMAADMWIETIPYQETRDYVKAILTYQEIYANLLGRDDKVLKYMHSMRIHPDGVVCTHAETDSQPIALC